MGYLTRADVEEAVRERAQTDQAFRDRLLADPRAVVGELIGAGLPDGVRVSVHPESLTDIHIVIPADASDALDDNDLELVSGGVCWNDDSGGSCTL